MKCEKFVERIADKMNIHYYMGKNGSKGYYIEFEYWSDLGEDVIISLVLDKLTKKEILHAMYECKEFFDAEEHATELFNLHGEHGTPTSLRALLQDADKQAEFLEKMYDVMLKESEA